MNFFKETYGAEKTMEQFFEKNCVKDDILNLSAEDNIQKNRQNMMNKMARADLAEKNKAYDDQMSLEESGYYIV